MSAYEELVERCATAYDNVLWGVFEGSPGAREMQRAASRAFLAEVLRTLEDAAEMEHTPQARTILDWLASSPLEPPK
jgi:hypothetical protein